MAVLDHMAEHNAEGRLKAMELNASPYRLDLDWRLQAGQGTRGAGRGQS